MSVVIEPKGKLHAFEHQADELGQRATNTRDHGATAGVQYMVGLRAHSSSIRRQLDNLARVCFANAMQRTTSTVPQ